MIKYSLYRVVASALVAVFTNVILNFINNTVHGDYSLGHWWSILIAWTVVIAAGMFACLKVSQLVNDLTTGGAYAGSGGLPIPILRRFL
jgi:ABC-type Fe3+-siderophore transport system permease subunit